MNNDHNNHDEKQNQLTISYELLCLLSWFLEHDLEKFRKLIGKALAAGLDDEIKQIEISGDYRNDPQLAQEMHYTMIDFFSILETILFQSMNEYTVQKAKQKNLMPAIEHIDAAHCDDNIVRTSVERANAFSERTDKHTPQEILFKELLRRWKPTKKSAMN